MQLYAGGCCPGQLVFDELIEIRLADFTHCPIQSGLLPFTVICLPGASKQVKNALARLHKIIAQRKSAAQNTGLPDSRMIMQRLQL